MRLTRITVTIEETTKYPALTGAKLLLADIVYGKGKVLEPAIVAIDPSGAGVGDQVLITTGSAARMPAKASGAPVDATIIAVVDRVTLSK